MPLQQQPPPPTEPRHVDPRLWRACAGLLVQIPAVHSRVYYFPQGHLEHACPSSSVMSSLAVSRPLLPCVVSRVDLLADHVTDQVFAKFLLTPVNVLEPSRNFLDQKERGVAREETNVQEDKVVPYAKVLTPSDANNGGGFSVPRYCADSIFPALDYQADPPVQTLSITDIHGTVWDFRHIYRGTPRRHLLTTGWSKFVNRKKLIAGDSVVFMKDLGGRMFVGIRRAVRYGNSGDDARWREQIGVKNEMLVQAMERAALGLPFEVVYYPKFGWPDYVVSADVVESSWRIPWGAGMRVKMVVETEDSSRLTWFQGTVTATSVPDSGPWCGSPWRMLQVTWDEPEALQHAKAVSPWTIEFVAPTPPMCTSFPPAKKLRYPQHTGLVTDEEGQIFCPVTGFNSTMGQMNPSLLDYNTFPAGMQGARQNYISSFMGIDFFSESACQVNQAPTNISFDNSMAHKLKNVSTELNIGNSLTENLSPDCHSTDSTKVRCSSIQLFGSIISINQPADSAFEGVASTGDDGCKDFDISKGENMSLDLSFPYQEVFNRMGTKCQTVAAAELDSCSL